MQEKVSLSLTVQSVIDNLDDFGLSDGDPEITNCTADGTLAVSDKGMRLSFTERSDSGEVTSTLYIRDGEVNLFKRGAIETEMRFIEGATEKTLYRVGPYAFDMEIKTKRIRHGLDAHGGELTLTYSMNIGGQNKNVRMKITAKRK